MNLTLIWLQKEKSIKKSIFSANFWPKPNMDSNF